MGAAFIAFKVARVLFPWLLSWRNMIPSPPRATIKALPSTPHRPRPYGSPGILPDFPTEVDAYWAHSLRPPGEHPTGPNELRPYAHFPLFPYLKCIGPCACPRGPAIPVGSTLSAILPVLWNNC